MPKIVLKVGLTGGIACGKSHVLARLAASGLNTLDLDAIAHQLMAPGGAAHRDVVAAFGTGVVDAQGRIDRRALGALVFGDPAARLRLNAIVHPMVRAEEARRAEAFSVVPGGVVVSDAAVLVESGAHLRFERLVVVHCSETEQQRRLMKRDGLSDKAALSRMASQMPVAEKRRFAHFDLDTSGSREETDRAADELAASLRQLAAQPRMAGILPLGCALGALLHGPQKGPRGLDPFLLIRELVEIRGLDMERLRQRLLPPAEGPWYRAARTELTPPGPETLAAPLVLWSVQRGGDLEFLVSAAATLARLTHLAPEEITEACLFALVLGEVASRGEIARDLDGRLAALAPVAVRWGGALPTGRTARAVRAAVECRTDPVRAREACRQRGGNGDLAAALVGLAVGASESAAPPPLVADLKALLRPSESAIASEVR